MTKEERMNKVIDRTVDHCMKQFNFADPKWDDSNFPPYDDAPSDTENTNESEEN